MTIARRKKWGRRGAMVVSIAWLLGVLVFAVLELREIRKDLSWSFERAYAQGNNEDWHGIGNQRLFGACYASVEDKQISCWLNAWKLAAVMLVPVVLLWIAAWLLTLGPSVAR